MPWRGERPEVLLLALALTACATGERALTAALAAGYTETGLASWYGDELAGRPTATGERFDPAGITAAHRTLPLGSVAEVTDLATGRAVLVRINDRGPHRADRLIDLSTGAARLLGGDHRALSRVRVRYMEKGSAGRITAPGRATSPVVAAPVAAGRYIVQVASFSDEARARALADRLGARIVTGPAVWRVRLGPFEAAAAERARDVVVARGYADAHLLATD